MVQLVDNVVERVLPRIRRKPALAYPVAIATFVIAALLRAFLSNWLPESMPFLTFYIAVLFATLLAGTGPGVLVVAASLLFAWRFYFLGSDQFTQSETNIALSAFAMMAGLIVAVVHLLNSKVESLLYERDRNEGLLQDSALGELQLEQLNVELRHRLKNTFAIIAGLVSQSARYSVDVSSFANALSGRLAAMGTAMDLVATRSFMGASLKELVLDTLKPLVPPGTSRMKLDGADGIVPGDVANALALTLHELGTNAIKYGAWSGESGIVRVSWKFDLLNDEDAEFELVWEEAGGPPVSQPERRGLGSLLIESGFPSATVERVFTERGVLCRMTAVIKQATTGRTRGRRSAHSK
jgi:two-component sensor histidine kinase